MAYDDDGGGSGAGPLSSRLVIRAINRPLQPDSSGSNRKVPGMAPGSAGGEGDA